MMDHKRTDHMDNEKETGDKSGPITVVEREPDVLTAMRFFNGDGPNTIDACIEFCGEYKASRSDGGGFLWVHGDDERVWRCEDGQWILKDCDEGLWVISDEDFWVEYTRLDI